MSVTEGHRLALHEAASQHWGRDVAVTLMEMLPPSGWGDVATRQQLDALESRIDVKLESLVYDFWITYQSRILLALATFIAACIGGTWLCCVAANKVRAFCMSQRIVQCNRWQARTVLAPRPKRPAIIGVRCGLKAVSCPG